ncbi:hypothetical protein KKH23_09255 [Patescibacteria group bacterium]|nr:hypothetical protein [Patescibacteria group bacterium]
MSKKEIRNSGDLTARQINKFIDKFTVIHINGEDVNPIPKDKKVTVFVDDGDWDCGFVCNTMAIDLGITALIAVSWIYEDDLMRMFKETGDE